VPKGELVVLTAISGVCALVWWFISRRSDEATELFMALRKYLRDAGVEIIDRHPR
jgi:hypothetical protein